MAERQNPFLMHVLESLADTMRSLAGLQQRTQKTAEETGRDVKDMKRGGRRRRGFDVLEGMPPGSGNARSLTKMLSGGVFGSQGQVPAVPELGFAAEEPAQQPSWRQEQGMAMRGVGQWLGTAGERMGGRFGRMVSGAGRFLHRTGGRFAGPHALRESTQPAARGRQWYSNDPTMQPPPTPELDFAREPDDRDGGSRAPASRGRQWYSDERRRLPPDWRQRVGGWAQAGGRRLIARGAAMEGRMGSVVSGAGRLLSGAGTALSGSGAAAGGVGAVGGAAAGGVGAAGGAGGVAAGTAGAAAGGGAVVAATGPLAAFAGVAVAAFGLQTAFSKLSQTIAESNRDLAKFSGSIATTFAMMDRQQMVMSFRTARATAGTARGLGEGIMQMREAMQPQIETFTNIKNLAGLGLTKVVILLTKLLEPVTNVVDVVTKFVAAWFGIKDEKLDFPVFEAMDAFVKDHHAAPRHKKPGEP